MIADENEQLKLALAEATLQLRIWHRGAAFADHVPSRTSKPSERQRVCRFRGFASWPTSRNPPIGDGAPGCVTGNPPKGRGRPRWRIVSRRWRLNTPRPGRPWDYGKIAALMRADGPVSSYPV